MPCSVLQTGVTGAPVPAAEVTTAGNGGTAMPQPQGTLCPNQDNGTAQTRPPPPPVPAGNGTDQTRPPPPPGGVSGGTESPRVTVTVQSRPVPAGPSQAELKKKCHRKIYNAAHKTTCKLFRQAQRKNKMNKPTKG